MVDDGSTDNTEEIVKSIKDQRVKYYKKKNEERAVAKNFGARKAKGEYVTFLDSDDFFYPNHLEVAKDFINNKKINILFQAYEIKDLYDNVITKMSYPNYECVNKLLFKYGNIMSCHGVFIKNKIVKQNPYNEDRDLSGSEDYELWLRLASQYYIYHNPNITSCLLEHSNRSVLGFNKEKLIKRKELFIYYLSQDKIFMNKYRKYLPRLKADSYSYVSLHLILAGYKKDAIKYLIKSILKSPRIIIKKRFFAIVKRVFV